MVVLKRTFLITILFFTLMFTGYQFYLIVSPLFTADTETRYVRLVEQYQILKMERLVLEEKYALKETQRKVAKIKSFSFASNEQLLPHSGVPKVLSSVKEEPIALSLAEAKTFEQLEAYVSDSKPAQLQPLSKDEKLILQAPAESYTLQLMGVRDANELTRFISDNQLQNAHVIHTYYLNKDWYVLVSGLYNNHVEALKAIDDLPRNIKDLKPWIRQMASLQKAIQLYRN